MIFYQINFFQYLYNSFLYLVSPPKVNAQNAFITGELKAFQKLTFTWVGPEIDESGTTFKLPYGWNNYQSQKAKFLLSLVLWGGYQAAGNEMDSSNRLKFD